MSDQFWATFFSTLSSVIISIVTTAAAVVVLWLKIREASDKSSQNADAIHEVKGMVNGKTAVLQDKVDVIQDKLDVANARATELAVAYAGADAKSALGEDRLGTIWLGLIRRGIVETYAKGLAKVPQGEAPDELSCGHIVLTDAARKTYEPIAPALRALHRKSGGKLTEEQLAEEIEVAFGPWLVRHICGPLGVNEMACLVMAIAVAKEPDEPEHGQTNKEQA